MPSSSAGAAGDDGDDGVKCSADITGTAISDLETDIILIKI